MPKASTRRGAAAAADMEQDAPAGEALPPPQALQDVAPMALFPPITASELLGGKIEWRKARDALATRSSRTRVCSGGGGRRVPLGGRRGGLLAGPVLRAAVWACVHGLAC